MQFHTPKRATWSPLLVSALALAMVLLLAACGGGGSSSGPTDVADTTNSTAAPVKAPEELVNDGKITFGTDFTFPPYESIDNGEQKGFDVEFAKLLGETLGLETEMIDTRFAVLIPGLEARHFDAILSALYITSERLETVDMVPYFNTGAVLVANTSRRRRSKSAATSSRPMPAPSSKR
ncbi:MAG TPA: transporter substrate-binding domain-containing protein [Solirubrobacterales bacterium]|jgi:ABC-type amino acid transport substrate-binding protein|nr:transporter substrate-binding domain-containing protein [Solirubrobacterales bacterium]